MKILFAILLIASACPLIAAPITFESPDYATATPLSTGSGATTDRLFDGQQGWSQSTSNHAGQITATTTSGSYTGGQGLTANTSNTTDASYIGAKAIGGLTTYSFDFLFYGKDLGVGGWNDDDADGKFDQTEAEFMAGYNSGTGKFSIRTAGFGTQLSTGTSGISGNWYRMTVTPNFATLQVTLAVFNLTTNTAVTLATSTFTLTSGQFGVDPALYEGIAARVTSNSTGPAVIDNISPDAGITFESPGYTTVSPLSTGTGVLTDRLFDGQQSWSQSTSSHAGQIIATITSGSYTGGQGLSANTSNTTDASYIGAKAGGGLISYSFDFLHQNKELGVGGWNDDDADGKFDQTEAEFMAGTTGGSQAFGIRTANFGTRISSGTTGTIGNWYRMTVTPNFANLQITLAVFNLTTNTAVTLTTSTFTLTAAQFGVDPALYDGIAARVTSNSTGPAVIDNISIVSSPTQPQPDPLPAGSVLIAPNGVWTWFNDNQSIILPNGRFLVGYVKSDGNISATNFDPVSATGSEIILSSAGAVQVDDHNNPSFTPLGDNRIFTAYSRHNPDNFWFHRTSTTSDPRSVADFSAQSQGPTVPINSYSNAFRLSAEGRIYHFSRGVNYNPTLTTSTDDGQNWTTPVQFIRTGTGGNRPYVRYSTNHTDRIDAIYTDGHPRDIPNSLYHLVISNGSVSRSDGSLIRPLSQLPLLHDAPDLERGSLIYTYSAAAWGAGQGPNDWIPSGRAWSWDIHRGSDDQPVAVFTVRLANATGSAGWDQYRIYYYYARWDGTQWQKKFIAQAGRPLYSGEEDYAGGICIDPQDPRVVYCSSNAASPFNLSSISNVPLAANARYELYRGFTADGGQTFTWEAVTQNSTSDNLRPTVPENHGRERTLLWFNGTYNSYTNFSTRVLGIFDPVTVSYADWAAGKGLAANSQNIDTDHDGLLNLLEYATGTEPLVADAADATTISPSGDFEFSARRERSDVEWIVEQSTDLTSWTTAAVLRRNSLPSSVSPGFTFAPVGTSTTRFRVTPASPMPVRSFFRLRANAL